MNLRGTNFVSQIFHISVVESTIKGLFGGDKYYFNVNVGGHSKVYYIEVVDHADGGESFRLYRDRTTYGVPSPALPQYTNVATTDELIKVIKSTKEQIAIGTILNAGNPSGSESTPVYADPKIVSVSETPAESMAKYALVYIDALQTV